MRNVCLKHLQHTVLGPSHTDLNSLREKLSSTYEDFTPIACGHWAYLIGPYLDQHHGHHLIDFYASKVPIWDDRKRLLVVPRESNPLYPLSDYSDAVKRVEGIMLEEDDLWRYYLIKPN